jgi:hypothetical protein
VYRSDLGTFQVTYAGHPLYLFDPGPNLETESPQAGTTYSSTVLAAEMLPNAFPGGATVSVYTFSADSHFSHCTARARGSSSRCTRSAPAVTLGVNPSAVGQVWRSDGIRQVTDNGRARRVRGWAFTWRCPRVAWARAVPTDW